MTARLTDEELEAIGDAFPTHLGEPPRSVLVQRLLAELRHLRAQALTAEDVEALRWARRVMDGTLPPHIVPVQHRNLARYALARLTSKEGT